MLRPLIADEWERFRDIRLVSLRTEAQAFGSGYERELQFDEAMWRSRLDGVRKRMFGLFDADQLVGISGVIPDPDDDSGDTAVLVASYILPSHRGRGFSALFFEERIAFARAENFKRITVSHRESNEISKRAILRAGFSEISRASKEWNNGTVEDQVLYELKKTP